MLALTSLEEHLEKLMYIVYIIRNLKTNVDA